MSSENGRAAFHKQSSKKKGEASSIAFISGFYFFLSSRRKTAMIEQQQQQHNDNNNNSSATTTKDNAKSKPTQTKPSQTKWGYCMTPIPLSLSLSPSLCVSLCSSRPVDKRCMQSCVSKNNRQQQTIVVWNPFPFSVLRSPVPYPLGQKPKSQKRTKRGGTKKGDVHTLFVLP